MLRFGDSELQMPTIIPGITVDRIGATYHLVSITFKLLTNIDYLDSSIINIGIVDFSIT